LPVTIYGVATALARNPEQVAAMKAPGWEIASHGLKWVDHRDMPEDEERAQIAEAIRLHTEVVGEPPRGWYTGRCSMNTVRLTAETGPSTGFPTPTTTTCPIGARLATATNWSSPTRWKPTTCALPPPPATSTGEQFFTYLKDSFDTLYAEGGRGGQGCSRSGCIAA
jgi:peptidoglycan/xylan/chitin deacetylase (PgdA/CDA1 family)